MYEITLAPTSDKRGSFRVKSKGLFAEVGGRLVPISDISHTGMFVKKNIPKSDIFETSIVNKGKKILRDIKCEVVRRNDNGSGLVFSNLEKRKQDKLDKLVVSIQKIIIDKKKKKLTHVDIAYRILGNGTKRQN